MSDRVSESDGGEAVGKQERLEKSKIFRFERGSIHYSNIEQTVASGQKDSPLAVHNYLCYQDEDKLIKVTEIVLEDKILRIRDQFTVISELNLPDKQQNEQKKPYGLFGRRNNYSDASKEEKSDTKNLIKNIVHLFGNWLRMKKTSETATANEKLRKIIKRMKYFNKLLIQELCKDKDICSCFIQFSETDSESSIENSRIKDKSCHYKAIKNYTKLFQESKSRLEKESTKCSESNMDC